ncbi:hypothetical protein EVAR_50992_1 [Eumeta japonica]|uniref:Uncharacterized protein n=1 Tax=Eumeta variegata TaxID=151549 RepID=A0A4C1ZYW8_EUMVA|nr:hypothetical protein EVAR_50992_1 [Eumeta japonica]
MRSSGVSNEDVIFELDNALRTRWPHYTALFHYGVLASTFRQHYQTLETNHGQSAFQDNPNNREHRSDTLFYYRVLVSTFWLHLQTLKIIHSQSTSQDDSYKIKYG